MSTSSFYKVTDTHQLLPVLESRIPRDAQVYNMVLMSPKFQDAMCIFTLGRKISTDTWVVAICEREDYGRDINISSPLNAQITPEIKEAFVTCKIFDWDKPYVFATLDRSISTMIMDISTHVYGNQTTLNPCNFYYFDPKEAKRIELQHTDDISIRPLAVESGGAEFLYKTWKYSKESTLPYLRKLVERNPSCGIYLNDKIISGLTLSTTGLMGFLYTVEEHRNKNYALMAMQNLIKDQANLGFVPCSVVEMRNGPSNSFHLKVGMKFSHHVDFMAYLK